MLGGWYLILLHGHIKHNSKHRHADWCTLDGYTLRYDTIQDLDLDDTYLGAFWQKKKGWRVGGDGFMNSIGDMERTSSFSFIDLYVNSGGEKRKEGFFYIVLVLFTLASGLGYI